MTRTSNAPLVRTVSTPAAPHAVGAFKPIGLAMAAVVAGLAPGFAAKADMTPLVRPDPGAARVDPAADQDDSLLLGPSEAVEPFSAPPARPSQPDLFD